MGVLTIADKFALRLLSERFVDYDEARKAPERKLSTIENLSKEIVMLLREFGLTPSSRSRISVISKPKNNEWKDL
jgi:phage terminase small subunit